MSIELLSMLGGGITGFVMRLVASQAEAQGRALDAMLQKQEMAKSLVLSFLIRKAL